MDFWTCPTHGAAPAAAHAVSCREPQPAATATDRAETDPCERGTEGCSVRHGAANTSCEGW